MTKNKKGFTIIEVVLVLAIAGLIFLMVFIALPALQRSQRNTRRRQDMARILAQFTEYSSNNGGQVPTEDKLDSFVQNYVGASSGTNKQAAYGASTCVGDQFCDPDGSPYNITHMSGSNELTGAANPVFKTTGEGATDKFSNHIIKYYTNATCSASDEGATSEGNGSRDIAILYMLEGGAVYCGDNH
jgi:prepilin-type N-terminal cleavage/methylation domain-containing protein